MWEAPGWDVSKADIPNVCNRQRVADLATVYLAVAFGLDVTTFLEELVYDPEEVFAYPSAQPDTDSAEAPMKVDLTKSTWYPDTFPQVRGKEPVPSVLGYDCMP